MSGRIVVVGAGAAGVCAAQSLRAEGHDGELVVIDRDRRLPGLMEQVSTGADERHDVAPRLCGLDAEWRLGTTAVGVEPDRRRLVLDDGAELPYDRLLLAPGCRPRPWPGRSRPSAGIYTVRGVDDVHAIRERLTHAVRLVVVGAGFLGCEVAAGARALGIDVVLCDAEATPLAGLGPEVGRATAALHDRAGVRLRLGCAVMGFEGGERLEGVRLADGSRIEADVAVLALGGVPDTEWLAGSGLPHDDGVRCDATLVVLGHPDIAAAGDAASWPHPLAGGQAVRVEHRANASRQGRAAAANLLREPRDRRVYDDVPTFSTDQYGITVDALGLPRHAERFHTCEGDASTGRFVVAGERAGRIVAAIAFDLGSRLPAYLPLVERRAGLDEALAAMA